MLRICAVCFMLGCVPFVAAQSSLDLGPTEVDVNPEASTPPPSIAFEPVPAALDNAPAADKPFSLISIIPEPAAMAVVGLGAVALLNRRRRRNSA